MKGLFSPQQSNTIKYFGKFWLQYAAIPCNSMFFFFKGLNLLAMRALGRRRYACAPENLSTSLRCRLGQIVPFKPNKEKRAKRLIGLNMMNMRIGDQGFQGSAETEFK
jgi:hypothetical protein